MQNPVNKPKKICRTKLWMKIISNLKTDCLHHVRVICLVQLLFRRFVQKSKNDAGKEMEKKSLINIVDLAGR